MTVPFKPARWLKNPHLQTCFPTISQRWRKPVPFFIEAVNLPDGDFIEIARLGNGAHPCVLLMPGLEGTLHSPYIQDAARVLAANGWQVVVMQYRACGSALNHKARTYNSYDDSDLMALLDFLDHSLGVQPQYAVGFSLGGNILLHHSTCKSGSAFKAIMTVSTPFDMSATVEQLPAFYQRRFVYGIKKKLIEKVRLGIAMPVSPKQIASIQTLRDLDNLVTAPQWGHADANDYYTHGSCVRILDQVRAPTLMVYAKDDPFIPGATVPAGDQLSELITIEVHPFGGHVGFVSSEKKDGSRLWIGSHIQKHLESFEREGCWGLPIPY